MGQSTTAVDDRINAAIEAAGIIPTLCRWYGETRITVEVGEVPPYGHVELRADWDLERMTYAFERFLELERRDD